MFEAVKRFGINAEKIDQDLLFRNVIELPGIQIQIIDLNQLQLYEQGIESDGRSTGTYTKASIRFKIIDRERYDHVTLKDTGEFYDSMKVQANKDEFVIKGDMLKPDSDLEERWPKALGLTDESLGEIMPEIKERVVESFKEKIFE